MKIFDPSHYFDPPADDGYGIDEPMSGEWEAIALDPALLLMPYAEYLRTPHWQGRRRRAQLRAGGMCQQCYADDRRLEVHHLTYDRRGQERESDLIVLCAACHAAEHGLTP